MKPTVDAPKSAPSDLTAPTSVPPPGPELLAALRAAEARGAPTWPAYENVPVPRLEHVPARVGAGGERGLVVPAELSAVGPGAFPRLRPAVSTVLQTRRWTSAVPVRAADQLRALAAAALYDLAGFTAQDLVAESDWQAWSLRDTAKKAAYRGRELWASIGAWPWWALGPEGKAHGEWWTLPWVRETFVVWNRDGSRRTQRVSTASLPGATLAACAESSS